MTFVPPIQPGTRYRLYITPRTGIMTYGDEVEVSQYILDNGIKVIQRTLDSQDYDIGVYSYSDLDLKVSNHDGIFNEEDARSIFPYFRDRAKVKVVFENSDGDAITYHGLINEEATRINALKSTIDFKVLSRDSVIRNTQIAGGTVASGVTVKTAMLSILANTVISSVLTVIEANINPNKNFIINIGTAFDDVPTQDALNQLLLASNSVMKLDLNGVVFVSSRVADTTKPALNLYGPNDIQKRQNIIDLSNYNPGLQRMFTSVKVTDANDADTIRENVPFATIYGYRQFQVSFNFLNDLNTAAEIAQSLLDEFSVPKAELEVTVETAIAREVDLTDRVSVNWPLRVTPAGMFMPVIGTSQIGNSTMPLPRLSGGLKIDPNMAFKIMEISEDPGSFTTTLKLRQIGITFSDGWFTDPASSVVGYAVIGVSKILGTGDAEDMWNPSVLGAALIGATEVA